MIDNASVGGFATECCYTVVGDCPVGRPFFVAGRARLASLEAGDGWANTSAAQGSLPNASLLDVSTRRALADFWSREALFEHASIASFSRFVLQLLALGAPLDLVRDASRAISEELTHAEVCLAFASAYEGAPLRPSALDVGGCLDGIEGKIAAAVGVAREGCIAETVSALQVSAARDAATDPAVRSALAIIAAQEMEHAVLSWRALSWLLSSGDPAMHAAVAEVFADARKHVGFGAVTEIQGDEKCMRGHGYLPVDERRAAAVASLSSVVWPCATALLGAVRLGSVSQRVLLPKLVTTTERVGRAMLEVVKHGAPKQELENGDINQIAIPLLRRPLRRGFAWRFAATRAGGIVGVAAWMRADARVTTGTRAARIEAADEDPAGVCDPFVEIADHIHHRVLTPTARAFERGLGGQQKWSPGDLDQVVARVVVISSRIVMQQERGMTLTKHVARALLVAVTIWKVATVFAATCRQPLGLATQTFASCAAGELGLVGGHVPLR